MFKLLKELVEIFENILEREFDDVQGHIIDTSNSEVVLTDDLSFHLHITGSYNCFDIKWNISPPNSEPVRYYNYDIEYDRVLKHSFLISVLQTPNNPGLKYIDKLDKILPDLKKDYNILKDFISEASQFVKSITPSTSVTSNGTCPYIFFDVDISGNTDTLLYINLNTYTVYLLESDKLQSINHRNYRPIASYTNIKSHLLDHIYPYLSKENQQGVALRKLSNETLDSDLINLIDAL